MVEVGSFFEICLFKQYLTRLPTGNMIDLRRHLLNNYDCTPKFRGNNCPRSKVVFLDSP